MLIKMLTEALHAVLSTKINKSLHFHLNNIGGLSVIIKFTFKAQLYYMKCSNIYSHLTTHDSESE